jgi:hypothetical protein
MPASMPNIVLTTQGVPAAAPDEERTDTHSAELPGFIGAPHNAFTVLIIRTVERT